MNSTQSSIHGHEVIHLIRDAEPAMSRSGLAAEVEARFGAGTRFHTCSANSMSLDELLDFLISRGKIIDRDGHLHAVMANVCGDGR